MVKTVIHSTMKLLLFDGTNVIAGENASMCVCVCVWSWLTTSLCRNAMTSFSRTLRAYNGRSYLKNTNKILAIKMHTLKLCHSNYRNLKMGILLAFKSIWRKRVQTFRAFSLFVHRLVRRSLQFLWKQSDNTFIRISKNSFSTLSVLLDFSVVVVFSLCWIKVVASNYILQTRISHERNQKILFVFACVCVFTYQHTNVFVNCLHVCIIHWHLVLSHLKTNVYV